MKTQNSAVNDITRRNFMKKSGLTAGAVTFLGRGLCIAAGTSVPCQHNWIPVEYIVEVVPNYKWDKVAFDQCTKCGATKGMKITPWSPPI